MRRKKNPDFSIVLFGGSGFTGKFVLEELLLVKADSLLGLPIAIAGRDSTKLRRVLADLHAEARVQVIQNVDINDQESLDRMCSSARLVLNVVGPYRLYGEPVVKACSEQGTDYLDISGEPEFMERMEAKYSAVASKSGCYIASGAGYDSVPGDFGTVIAQREFSAPSIPSSVEAYLSVVPGHHGYKGHFATWQSAVLGIASVGSLRKLREQVKAAGKAAVVPRPLGPRPVVPSGIEFIEHSAVRSFSVPFPGADASVVRRTQGHFQALGQPTVHFTARFLLASRWYAYLTAATGLIMSVLAKTRWGRALLLRFPGFFSCGAISHEGPSKLQMESTKCVTTLVAKGYQRAPGEGQTKLRPDREVVLRMTGPDPGYRATAAISLLLDREKLPAPGVKTVGALLCDTKYSERLTARGIVIEKISDVSYCQT